MYTPKYSPKQLSQIADAATLRRVVREENLGKLAYDQQRDAEDLGADEAQLAFNARVLAYAEAADDQTHQRLIGAGPDEWASAMERAERAARRAAR